ncbi:hypothetical protein PR048_016916 [Dryococelus australis]|uniref:Uncharacterized protein n=1 Tax=Dryococelus australis TaxID=614101 RepID=A0ABQ9H848_9NEOP|nr:hypothetical protein PR048_016916 [Dryococelus australis]
MKSVQFFLVRELHCRWLCDLDRSPIAKANRFQSPAGSLPDFCKGESCRRMCRWSADFLGDLPFPPTLHFRVAQFSNHLTLIGSLDITDLSLGQAVQDRLDVCHNDFHTDAKAVVEGYVFELQGIQRIHPNLRKPFKTNHIIPQLFMSPYFAGYHRPAQELKGGETGDPRENPPTSDIVRHDSHWQKSGSDPAGDWTRTTLVVGEQAKRSATLDHQQIRYTGLLKTQIPARPFSTRSDSVCCICSVADQPQQLAGCTACSFATPTCVYVNTCIPPPFFRPFSATTLCQFM